MLRVYPLPHAFPPTVLGCEAHPCDKRGRSPSAVANQRASPSRPTASAADTAVYPFDYWFDPIEAGVRERVREFIQAMVEGEPDATLMRRQRKASLAATNAWRYRPPAGIV